VYGILTEIVPAPGEKRGSLKMLMQYRNGNAVVMSESEVNNSCTLSGKYTHKTTLNFNIMILADGFTPHSVA